MPAFNVPLVTMPHSESSGLNELTGWSVPAESEAPSSSQARTGMISRVRSWPQLSRSTEASVYRSGCWIVTGIPSRMARARCVASARKPCSSTSVPGLRPGFSLMTCSYTSSKVRTARSPIACVPIFQPRPTYGEVGQGEQIVRVPEQVPPVARIVHIRLIEGTSFGSAIQDKLESPKLELIVPKATAHTKTLNDGHPLCRRGGHWREHKSAAYGQLT